MVRPWVLALVLPVFLLGATPTVDRPVMDPDGLMSADDVEAVAESLVRLRKETGAQMAVVVVRTTGGEPIEDYTLRAAEAWKGGGAGKDDGLLFVLAVEDRRQRLEVGYGLEEHLPDDAVRTLLDSQRGLLRDGNYRGAVLGVVQGVRARLPGADGVVVFTEAWNPRKVGHAFLWMLAAGLGVGVLGAFFPGSWWERFGPARTLGAVGALLGAPMAAIALFVHRSGLPTLHFLLTYAAFAGVFYLVTLAVRNSMAVPGLALAGSTLLGAWMAGTQDPSDNVLSMLTQTMTCAGMLTVALLVFLFGNSVKFPSTTYGSRRSRWGASSRRASSRSTSSPRSSSSWGSASSRSSSSWGSSSSSSRSSSSSSSSSSRGSSSRTSWGGGGGSFGGGGASSSW